VLELARILAGPWAGQMLADLGADVVKGRAPKAPATIHAAGARPSSRRPTAAISAAAYFPLHQSRQALDRTRFETEEGRRIVRKLAARSDVLIENFKVGDSPSSGLDYTSLSKENPRLIYCSGHRLRQSGPYAARAGYDLMAQGMGGLMELTGAPDGEPQRGRRPRR